MKKIKILLTTAILGLLFTGCDKDFDVTNTNPNDAVSIPSDKLIADVARNAGNIMNSTFVGGDMGDCWAQHWAKTNYEEEARYDPRESVIEGFVWQGIYEDVIADAKSMEDLAIAEGNDYSRGAALVLQAYGYHILTDVFGMIPFTEAMDPTNLNPVYDSQEVVYAGILNMLDTANVLLSTGSGSLDNNTDLVYGGDHTGWLKFANSLKFRCLMRISGVQNVAADLQDIVSNREIITSNDDEATMIYLSADPNANPMYESIVYGSRTEYVTNEVLIDMLVDLNDPRLEVYAEVNNDGIYRGKPSGINNVPSEEWNVDNVSAIGELLVTAEWPHYFVSYSELMFLMAEAAERGLITGDAETYYNEGILASLTTMGVEDQYADYILETGVSYSTVADNRLQQIAEQNWLGLYCQGIESWTEWRRTKYPELEPAIEAVIPSIPSRFTYPPIEQSVNADSYQAAVNTQGDDLLTTDIWWMQ